MPYKIQFKPVKSGKNWAIIRKGDRTIAGRSHTKKNAEASIRARLAGEHGWKPIKTNAK